MKICMAFDLDGTLVDTPTAICNLVNEKHNLNTGIEEYHHYKLEKVVDLAYEQVREIIDEVCSINYVQYLNPIPGAMEFLRYWYEQGNHINIVTTRWNEEPLYLFFEKHLPDICIDIYSARHKTGILKKLNVTHFIDDHPETALYLANAGIQPIVFDQPYNRKLSRRLEKLIIRVKSWKEMMGRFG